MYLEYGESYFLANEKWIEKAKERMSPEAFALAVFMAEEDEEEE